MAFLNIPVKSIQASITSIIGVSSMPWYDPLDFPVGPGDPYPTPIQRDYRWRIVMDIAAQNHSSAITRDPGTYNGQDVSVGQWIANAVTGQVWQIITIDAKTSVSVTAVVQDVYRYNTFRDATHTGRGGPSAGLYIIFNLSESGVAEIDPVPAGGISASFATDVQSRFEYINLQYDYPLYQLGNTFAVNDVIAASMNTNEFVLSDANNRIVVGRVTSISDTITGWFTINPVQKIVDNLDYLPGNIGDIIYSSLVTAGEITTVPGGTQLYIKLRDNTSSVSLSTAPGPTTPGNVFQLNEINVTVTGTGVFSDIVTDVNGHIAQTGVTASQVLAASSVQTNNALITVLYGEPALWASSSPASATINGTTVTFNITSEDPGYTDYARAAEMAQSINDAAITNIVASTSGVLVLIVTNTAGGAITIVNVTSDINGVPVAGTSSGSGLALSTPASTTYNLKFLASDARAINFLNVDGSVVEDFGLVSVENGVKACGLYIEEGLRTATSTVVTDLVQLNALSPLIGDQAYVIDSEDGQGNNAGEWSLWLFDGSIWVQTSNQSSALTDAKSLEYTVIPSTPASVNVGIISTGRRVALITVEVTTPFDGTPSLTVGYLVNNPTPQTPVPAGLMVNGLIDLTVAGTYTTSTDVLFGVDTVEGDVTITAAFTNGAATVGSAQLIISYV